MEMKSPSRQTTIFFPCPWHSDRFRLLQEKCIKDPQFSRLIKELDLRYVDCPEEYRGRYHYGPNILPALLPTLLSLERLHLPSEQLNSKLLATFNSHPTLLVVETSDPYLNALREMASETTESMSKIQVVSATLDLVFGFDDPAFHSLMSRSPRVVHLELRDEINITSGPGTVVIPGLETLGIQVCRAPSAPMTWEPAFIERHSSVKLVRFFGHDSLWNYDWASFWPLSRLDVPEGRILNRALKLVAFSISPTKTTPSFDDWPVTEVELELTETAGVCALPHVNALAPSISSIILRMTLRAAKLLVHFDDFVSSLSVFTSLQKLELHHLDRRLVKEEIPKAFLVQRSYDMSGCVEALVALRSLSACIANRAPSLAVIHVTDDGFDSEPGYGPYSWRLNVTYKVTANREIEFDRKTRFDMVGVYRPPDEIASRLCMTESNTCYHPPYGIIRARSQRGRATTSRR
ncbi:hypothetical protein R3P38DRAFT_853240 [Favolaschia claudopus]|uniref:Uncharacterized protein n=1 Tax=Favolaschia claudopus TaxID=2862362 RepID=A0AAW0BV56_9AGAR